MSSPIYIGRHHYSIEGDLFHMTPEGDMSPAEAKQMSTEMVQMSTRLGRITLLIDLNRMEKPSPETRRVIMQSIRDTNLSAVAFYGAGIILRTALTLVNRAAAIMKGHDHPTRSCATEAEARAWLSQLNSRNI